MLRGYLVKQAKQRTRSGDSFPSSIAVLFSKYVSQTIVPEHVSSYSKIRFRGKKKILVISCSEVSVRVPVTHSAKNS